MKGDRAYQGSGEQDACPDPLAINLEPRRPAQHEHPRPEPARLSGIRVGWIRVLTFAISGFAAGLAGLIASSRVATGQADAGTLIEFTAIAAVVIGGTSIMGGEGTIWRTVVGVLLLALIGNGFNMLSVNPFYQDIVKGAIIVLAVAFDAWSKRRA